MPKKDQPFSRNFINTKLPRADITFDEQSEYAILRLGSGVKPIDYDHKVVEIVLAATHSDKQSP
jgi:hypothetical protein